MPDVEVVQERHSMESSTSDETEAAGNYERGKEESGFARYKIIRRSLLGAMALFPHSAGRHAPRPVAVGR